MACTVKRFPTNRSGEPPMEVISQPCERALIVEGRCLWGPVPCTAMIGLARHVVVLRRGDRGFDVEAARSRSRGRRQARPGGRVDVSSIGPTCSSVVVKAYVINLARATDRRSHMVKQLARAGVDFEFVEAVDGRSIEFGDNPLVDLQGIQASGKVAPASVSGSVGCTLSHLAVWRLALEKGLSSVLVLEDDVELPDDFGPLASCVADLMSGAEVALLDFHAPGPVLRAVGEPSDLPGKRRLFTSDGGELRAAGAYVATAQACKGLVASVLPVRSSTDDWASYVAMRAIDRLRFVEPMPVHQVATFRSTIDTFAPHSLQTCIRETVAHTPGISQLVALRRRRRFERNGWTGDVDVEVRPEVSIHPQSDCGEQNGPSSAN